MNATLAHLPEPLKTGIYYDIPPERYHRDDLTATPALTASMIVNLTKMSPARAWAAKNREWPEKKCLEFGRAAHIAFLERKRLDDAVVFIDSGNYRDGIARTARKKAREDGRTPLLPKDVAKLEDMAAAMRNELPRLPFNTAAPFLGGIFDGGHAEVTAILEGDPILKIRPDYVREGDGFDVLVDYKTTSYESDRIVYQARRGRWDIIATFYCTVWEAVTGRPANYLFAHQNVEWPHFVYHSIIHPSDAGIAAAQIEDVTAIYRECLLTGRWESGVETPQFLQINRREENE